MKTQKMKLAIIGLMTLTALDAGAQINQNTTTPDLNTQLNVTRDFVGGIINQSRISQADRLSLSEDYAIAAPLLQDKVAEKLNQFRNALPAIFGGSLVQMIDEYNQNLRDKNSSPADTAAKKTILLESITNLANGIQSAYQAQIRDLYLLEPSLYFIQDHRISDLWSVSFADGHNSQGIDGWHYYPKAATKNEVAISLNKILMEKCKSKMCYSLLYNDYASYFNQVRSVLNKSVVIKLIDSTMITIKGLDTPVEWNNNSAETSISVIMNLFQSFKFGNSFNNLPNASTQHDKDQEKASLLNRFWASLETVNSKKSCRQTIDALRTQFNTGKQNVNLISASEFEDFYQKKLSTMSPAQIQCANRI